jgi:quercetin dioxygenase-like cupin family protein
MTDCIAWRAASVVAVAAACGGHGQAMGGAATPSVAASPRPLVLEIGDGERRVRRVPGAPPFIIKVDPQNGGSPDLVMGYENIAPGDGIAPHRHLLADEILFVHRGQGEVLLGDQVTPVQVGATIYIPRNTRVALRATGSDSLGVAFIFSHPGMEQYLRATSVREGDPALVLDADSLRAIRLRQASHTLWDQP